MKRLTKRNRNRYEDLLGKYNPTLTCDKESADIATYDFVFVHCLNKLGELEDIEEWFSELTFYGKVLNFPGEILKIKFKKLDFRPNEYQTDNQLLIHFGIENGGCVMYSVFDYGKMWSLRKEDLCDE